MNNQKVETVNYLVKEIEDELSLIMAYEKCGKELDGREGNQTKLALLTAAKSPSRYSWKYQKKQNNCEDKG
jgi:hypothetical protein